ncbi:MAG TPA: hypothetical protein VL092_02675 [Chitinophagaceae bacterium]|nr:hypothetical protein [Chitinophagaceae bacterium]
MKLIRSLFLYVLFAAQDVPAQDFSYAVQVTQVQFSGSGAIPVREDSLGNLYGPVHWRNTGLRVPAAFISGSTMNVTAIFLFNCVKAPDSIVIRGFGADTIDFPARTVALSSAGGTYTCTYPVSAASKAFRPGFVNYYAPFTIRWEISMDKGVKWLSAATTDHKVYVTRGTPSPEMTAFKYYHTVLELSCKNAKGQSTDTGIISKCWSEFTDQVVLNHKGDSLHYYKTFNTSNTNLPALLRYRNAQCYTFAQLFAALIKIQGISRTNNYVYITPQSKSSPCGGTINRFLVKNWNFGTKSDAVSCPSFPYRNTYSGTYLTPTGYVFTSADVSDQSGVSGQCNKNPSSFFNNHQITKFDGVYYDACYGMKFSSLADIKTRAFDAWAVQLSPGTYNFTSDMTQCDLIEIISTF